MVRQPTDAAVERRALRLVHEALDRSPEDRASWLDQNCGSAGVLRARVERLLELHGVALAPLAWPTDAPPALEGTPRPLESVARPGERVGPWELGECLGRGGMGEVWRARRADGRYEREVALKLVRAGFASSTLAARFERERNLLARLRHRNVATLYDGGLDGGGLDGGGPDGGRPWLAMELVDGEPIDAYCERAQLSVEQRVRLLLDVARAVEYVHAELVLHRDLKPSNVLVDAAGRAVLLDFGIAKLVEGAEQDGLDLTRTAERALTPRYACPEALRGEPATAATDVWSLGVMLHELLVGVHPFDREDEAEGAFRGGPEGLQLLERGLPELPSARARRAGRADAARLEGDLDTILAVALHPDRERRYRTVARFANDLERWLGGWPVSARPDTLGYRARKFAGRNRLALALSATAVAALIGGLAFSTSQYLRAERARAAERAQRELAEKRFHDSRRFASGLMFDLTRKVNGLSRIAEANAVVLETGVAFLDRLSEGAEDDPALMRDLVQGYLDVARGRGSLSNVSLSEPEGARRALERALRLATDLYERDPAPEENAQTLADARQAFGVFEVQWGDWNAGLEHHRAVLALCARHEPLSRFLLRRLAKNHELIAVVLTQSGDLRRASEHFESALKAFERIVEMWPEGSIFVAGSRSRVALGLVETLNRLGEFELAVSTGEPALATLVESAELHPPSASIRQSLSNARVSLARAYGGLARWGDAEAALDAAAEDANDLVRADSSSDVGLFLLFSTFVARADLAAQQGDGAGARENDQRAIEICRTLARRQPQNSNVGHSLATLLRRRVLDEHRSGNEAAAAELAREAAEVAERTLSEAPANTAFLREALLCQEALAVVLETQDPAQPEADAARERQRELEARLAEMEARGSHASATDA